MEEVKTARLWLKVLHRARLDAKNQRKKAEIEIWLKSKDFEFVAGKIEQSLSVLGFQDFSKEKCENYIRKGTK